MSNSYKKLLIFDVDGTLYSLNFLRVIVFFDLILLIIRRKVRWRDLKYFLKYRVYRESLRLHDVFITNIHESFCRRYSLSIQYLESIIKQFTETHVLKYLYCCRHKYVIAFIENQMNHANVVCFLSDYPVEQKLLRLGINATSDKCYSSMDISINRLKPSAIGLQKILQNHPFPKRNVFLIGDSVSRDGTVANSEGVHFIKINRKNIRKLHKELISN